jgi:hypothetical protein
LQDKSNLLFFRQAPRLQNGLRRPACSVAQLRRDERFSRAEVSVTKPLRAARKTPDRALETRGKKTTTIA